MRDMLQNIEMLSMKTFYERVYQKVREIPEGRVTSYGAIAKALGTAGSSRMVGYALRSSQGVYPPVPAHRVVNRIGMLSGKAAFGSLTMMQQLLENESIVVENDLVVDFKNLFWQPDYGE
jgi:methylated-DNA-protein-cysteine methyltransferase-like protein